MPRSLEFQIWAIAGKSPNWFLRFWQKYRLKDLITEALKTLAYRDIWHNLAVNAKNFHLEDLSRLPVIKKEFFRLRRPGDYLTAALNIGFPIYFCDSRGEPLRFFADPAFQVLLKERTLRSSRKSHGYSLPIFGAIAFSCPQSEEGYHVYEESLILEIVDDCCQPLKPGQKGRLVITYFDNLLMPFLRYDTNEKGFYSSKFCGCGKVLLIPEIKEIKPLLIGDRVVYKGDFDNIFRFYCGFIDRYEIKECSDQNIRILIKPGRFWQNNLISDLRRHIEKLTGRMAKIEFQIQ